MSQGNPQDGYVQVAGDGSGKKIDNAELTRDDGTVVERQRVVLASDENPRTQVDVRGEAGRGVLTATDERVVAALEMMNQKLDMLVFGLSLALEVDLNGMKER